MTKRIIIVIAVTLTLTFGISALWSAETNGRDGDTDANILSDGGSPTGKSSEEKKKSGNRFARIFGAPFRAVGKLFGRGKDDNKIERLTEKDVAKFESGGVARVEDSRTDKVERNKGSGTAREHLVTGRALLSTNRISEAITELTTAASLDSHLSEAQNLLGIAYDRKGMPERAREAYERAMKETPEDAETLNNLGFSLYQNGNYRAAVDRLKRAIKLAPTDTRILNNLGLAQARLGKYDDAYKNFARAGGELTGRLNTAAMLERAGRDDEAIKYYEGARSLQPNSSLTLRRLADLYQRAGKPDQAQATRRALGELASAVNEAGGK